MATDHQTPRDDGTAQRLDKWLWFARLAKTRSLAQQLVLGGHVRVNRERVIKPAQLLRPGDLVTVRLGERLRLLQVAGPGSRRGPAPEAAGLYVDLAPAPERNAGQQADTGTIVPSDAGVPRRDPGSGRPTKRDRRQTDRLKSDP
jgi:ribosome-associated heat shock protein Hsp15